MLASPLLRAFAVTGAIAVLALGAVSMASAAPADATSYRECFTEDSGNTICYTIHDVEKYGAGHSTEVGSLLTEYYGPDGNLLWSSETRWHTNVVEKDGSWQVYHDQTKATVEQDGESCTAVSNVTYANGDTRHLGPEWAWVCK